MKFVMFKVSTNNELATKKLPMIVELDAVKSIIIDTSNKEIRTTQQYKEENQLQDNVETICNITIKWTDGDSNVYSISQNSMDSILTHIYTASQNEIFMTDQQYQEIQKAIDDQEYDEEEEDEEDEEDEEEIEEEVLENDSPTIPKGV